MTTTDEPGSPGHPPSRDDDRRGGVVISIGPKDPMDRARFIVDNWQTMTDKEIGTALGKGANHIALTRATLGIYRPLKTGKDPRATEQQVREIRNRRIVGQIRPDDVATESGYATGTIYSIETGHRKLTVDGYNKITAALDRLGAPRIIIVKQETTQ